MIKRGTTFLYLLAGLFIAGNALAQPMQVTLRDINAISQANVDVLNAGGATLTQGDIQPLVINDLQGVEVQFVAVVLSDPLSSGLGTPQTNDGGNPDRIHVYVRDTSAVSMGYEGMGVQLVDGSYKTTGLINVTVGDVVKITGSASAFTGSGGNSQQVGPTTVEVLGSYSDLGLPASLLDPVVITSDEANMMIDENGGVQVNWSNLASLNGQYVRLEGATIVTRDISTERPNWLVSSDDGTTVLNFYDMSLRYRNDRDGAYPANFNVRSDDFVPPPPGSRVNIQGFLVYQGDDPFSRGVPNGALLSIAPYADSDLEITESPPIITDVMGPDYIPDGSAPVDITASIAADPSRTISEAVVLYTTSDNATEQSVSGTETDGTYTFSVPAQGDGVFVTYVVEATDSDGAVSTSDAASYRTLFDGINEISDVQTTADEGPGDSPFRGLTTAMDITATVQNDPGASGFIVLQDKEGLDGWSGVLLNDDETQFSKGDIVNITEALIFENFGVTELRNATYTITGSEDTYGYKIVPTTALTDASVAEAHEGMMLRFENIVLGPNPDAPNDFGEWSFASAGTEDFIRADDASNSVPSSFNDALMEGAELAFIQGIWWYSFGNYKLIPESPEDVDQVGTANEDEILPNRFALSQNFPNPFNPTTTIRYQIATASQVRLEVFDLLGRQVETLVDGVVNAGEHLVTFDAQGLPSGLYLYRLSAGDDVSTKKMLLLK